VLIDGMGHDLPEELWDQIVGELKTNFAKRLISARSGLISVFCRFGADR
jgi:hypothetical protein